MELPEATQRAVYERALATRDSSPRCPLLDAEARCVVYSARPIICRSHGVPVRTGERRDVCPLNFKDAPLETIDDDCVLDLEHTNAILSVIDQLMTPGQDRVDLVGGLTQLLAP